MQPSITDQRGDFLTDLQQRFAQFAGEDHRIDLAELQAVLDVRDPDYASKIFRMIDREGSGTVSCQEFLAAIESLTAADPSVRLHFVFQLHDDDGDGLISCDEVRTIFHASLHENQLRFAPDVIEALIEALFEETDRNADGGIAFDEFKAAVEAHPSLYRQMTLSAATWLQPPPAPAIRPKAGWSTQAEPLRRTTHYLQNYWNQLLFLSCYISINLWLFQQAIQYYASVGANGYVQLARGCGACLNFNGALILIPVMRQMLTWLRRTVGHHYLPLDASTAFHKLVVVAAKKPDGFSDRAASPHPHGPARLGRHFYEDRRSTRPRQTRRLFLWPTRPWKNAQNLVHPTPFEVSQGEFLGLMRQRCLLPWQPV